MVANSTPPSRAQAAAPRKIRSWHLINLLSLDAVMVGLTWQLIFTLEFLNRFPHAIESLIIGITIWLAYTADRILDSWNLETNLPHTSRHYFHHQFRTPMCCFWTIALGFDVILIASFTHTVQIQWGLVCLFVCTSIFTQLAKKHSGVESNPEGGSGWFHFCVWRQPCLLARSAPTNRRSTIFCNLSDWSAIFNQLRHGCLLGTPT